MIDKILHQTSWAKSASGKNIELYKSLRNDAAESTARPILFVGGVHGDEPEGVQLARDLLNWLQKNHNKSDLCHSWILIPCLNIDGYLNGERTNGNGVDLNRNFPSRDWSQEHKAPRYFPGVHSSSEPETRALIRLIESEQPKLIVHFHSWEACVVYTGASGKKPAEIIGLGTGYRVAEDIGYPTPGSLGQYAWLEKNTPVICVEAQEHSDLNSIWPIFGPGLIRLLQEATIG